MNSELLEFYTRFFRCFLQPLFFLGKVPQKTCGSLNTTGDAGAGIRRSALHHVCENSADFSFCVFFFPAVLAFIYVNHPNEVDFTSGSKKSEAPVPKNYSHQAHSCLSFVLKSDGKICCEMVTLHFKSKIWY